MCDMCGDNRFEVIEKAKEDLLNSTNIKNAKDEMKVLDNFLFRCWQMGWLKQYDETKNKKLALIYLEELKNGLFGHCRSSYLKDCPEELEKVLKTYEVMFNYIKEELK